MIPIDDKLSLDPAEVTWSASRSGGPGGQNVNKVATKVTLRFDVRASTTLDDGQKGRILRRLSSRLTRDGVLVVSCQAERSQKMNREAAERRLAELIQDALEVPKERRPTRMPRSVRRRRLRNKKHRSQVKRGRSRPAMDD